MPASAILHSVANIMIAEPRIVMAPLTMEVTELLRVCERVSTSLETRESVSPTDCLSKYAKGRRSILRSRSERIFRAVHWVARTMSRPSTKLKRKDPARIATEMRVSLRTSSMFTRPASPFSISSVMSDRYSGAMTVSTAPATAMNVAATSSARTGLA